MLMLRDLLQKLYRGKDRSYSYIEYLIREEIDQSDYLLYEHKKTKKILNEILRKYSSDFHYEIKLNWYGNRVLIITLFDYPLNDDGGNTFMHDWVKFEAQSY